MNKYETVELNTENLVIKKGTRQDCIKIYEYDMLKCRGIAGEDVIVKSDKENNRSEYHGYRDLFVPCFEGIYRRKKSSGGGKRYSECGGICESHSQRIGIDRYCCIGVGQCSDAFHYDSLI